MPNKRSIPEIRARLRELAEEHGLPELAEIAEEMQRSTAITRAKPRSASVTPEMAEDIRDYAKQNPQLHQRHVAQHFNVNPGAFRRR